MHYRRFGRVNWQVSEIGYGMWGMGGWTGSDDDESRAALDRAVELGCKFFDTACAYGEGNSETAARRGAAAPPGKRLYIATKVPPKNWSGPAAPTTPSPTSFPPTTSRDDREEPARTSASTTHRPPAVPRVERRWADDDGWQRAVEDLKRAGLIGGLRHQRQPLGAGERAQGARHRARRHRAGRLQRLRSESRGRAVPGLPRAGIAVIARVPFDEGSLTGTLTRDSRRGPRATGATCTSRRRTSPKRWRASSG